MKHMADEGDMEDKKKLEAIEEELRDKEEELEGLESLNSSLIVKGCKANDEIQEARKQLITVSFWFSLIVINLPLSLYNFHCIIPGCLIYVFFLSFKC